MNEMTKPDDAIKVLDKGHVYLKHHIGSDIDIANAARVSFSKVSSLHDVDCPMTNSSREHQTTCICDLESLAHGGEPERVELSGADRGLINFLIRNRHSTPFEHNSMTFVVKAPIFVFREWHRHRIGVSINEMSLRYTPAVNEWYVPEPDQIRVQKGKPGAYTFEPLEDQQMAVNWCRSIDMAQESAYATYQMMVNSGVAKEVARTVLPVGMYSEMYWTVNLRSLMNFISLRNHRHAQYEIRMYAQALEKIASELFPVAMQAFIDNDRKAP